MTPEEKQRLAEIRKTHAPHREDEDCDGCLLLTLLDQAQRSADKLTERSVAAMSIAEDDPSTWKNVEIDCPMLQAVYDLRVKVNQAQRDTERVVVLTDRAFHKELSDNNHYWELRDLIVNYKKEHFAEALDQAALARVEGEK